jgi:hypothetical protein
MTGRSKSSTDRHSKPSGRSAQSRHHWRHGDDQLSAGATGNFSTTITNSGTGNAGYAGIVVAIKAAAGGGGAVNRIFFPMGMDGLGGGIMGSNRLH